MIDFTLPKELIAQKPVSPRDSAKLLVYNRRTKSIVDSVFSDLDKWITPNSTLVSNNSKVENCRWLFNGGRTEIFVLEKLDAHTIRALIRPGKKFTIGKNVELTDWLVASVEEIDNDGIRTLRLNTTHDDKRLDKVEHIPLPPYIEQNDTLAKEYQTVYAKLLGSKAAPTAGLHFTDDLLDKIRTEHEILELTLHVGLGTFAPLNDENFKSGKLHKESYEITTETLARIQTAEHITSVGTTTTRTLESLFMKGRTSHKKESQRVKGQTSHTRQQLQGSTDIFIKPGYKFKSVDSLVTNFHLPGTSLLLMVEAFVGSESELTRIYNHAILNKYRFYSFGDAMLIL